MRVYLSQIRVYIMMSSCFNLDVTMTSILVRTTCFIFRWAPCQCLVIIPFFLLSILSPLTSLVVRRVLKILVISCLPRTSGSIRHVHTNGSLPGSRSAGWVCLFLLYTCLVFLFISYKWVCVCGVLCALGPNEVHLGGLQLYPQGTHWENNSFLPDSLFSQNL